MKNLIIIPGWGGTKETWQKFIKLSEKDFNVYCLDMPCFGDEPCPKEVWGVEDYANFVKQKIEKLNLVGEKILLGHSFGGQISAYLVANSENLVDNLVLSGPAIFRSKNYFKRAVFFILAKIGKIFFKIFFLEKLSLNFKKILYKTAKSPDYNKTSEIKQNIFKKIIRQDLEEEVKKINIKTFIIWGDKDSYISVKKSYKLNKIIKNSKLKIVEGGKHGLHLQMPENFLNLIKDFSK